MKLESLLVRNFRSIPELELSFQDDLGLILNCLPIVGPNTSGKTTILDAIALCLMPVTEVFQLREGLRLTAPALVRSGEIRAEVHATVWFSDEEVEVTREVMDRSRNPYHRPLPAVNRVTVRWTYPDPLGRYRTGFYECDPPDGWLLFRGRKVLTGNLHVPGLGSRLFSRLGTVVMFDQQRTGLSRRLSFQERRQLGQLLAPGGEADADDEDFPGPGGAPRNAGGRRPDEDRLGHTSDPRLILTSLAMRAQVAQDPDATEKEDFAQLKALYERVCHPHTIGQLFNTDYGLDMEFTDGKDRYFYDGLSSGQQMILLMLLQYATRRLHRSIILTDELELHLHPLWQDRLYASLGQLGRDNQHIFTTHSTHLRDSIRDRFHTTGNLVQPPAGP